MSKNLVVVGIGSSAGGLEALQVMLSKVSDSTECSYIIAQHLSPTHRSMMVELLSRVTNIPVIEVQNGMVIKQKTIYMTPENTDIYISNGRIYLRNIEQTYGPKPSINYFFNSLAQSYGSRAIGIILSGTGSDGAFGIRAIKASGGITIAQSPQSAKYDGMPVSAINTGKVDLVVSIDNMANEVTRIVGVLGKNIVDDVNETTLGHIYRAIFEEKGVDFSGYKKSTIVRRIQRRLSALKMDTLNDYVDYINSNPDEVSNLYHDMLIGVTEFFRDTDVFEEVRTQIEEIVAKKEQGEEIRFWSIGCSTGEEPYSLAIMLSEILKERITKYKIKIFATDIDDEALKIARAGIYAETSLVNMDKNLITKYFSIQKNQFEIKKSLRELVVFSKHNIISDSPFLRIDMVVCRNMLIYFNNILQHRFFPIVHYALKDNGVMVLGKSESIGEFHDLFITTQKTLKIFKAQYTGIKELPKLYNYGSVIRNYEEPKIVSYKNDEEILEEKITEATAKFLLNQCVVVNSSNDIVYIKGEIAFLKFAQGRASTNLFKSIRDELSLDVRSLLSEAQRDKTIKSTQFRAVELYEGLLKYVRVTIIPIQNEKNEDWFYALFFISEDLQNLKGYITSSNSDDEAVIGLTKELERTKSHLQNVIEELETSYEEMQSLNEELSSSNEELQSSNEELETTNEELQSTNEELQTAYSELKALYEDKENRTKELEELTQRLKFQTQDIRKQKELTEAIINTTPIAIVMTDVAGKINFANFNAEDIFKFPRKELLQKYISDSSWKLSYLSGEPVPKDEHPLLIIKKSFESLRNQRYSIETAERYKIAVSISGAPLFDMKGEFVGVVFSIEDITKTKIMQDQLKSLEEQNDINIEKTIAESIDKLKTKSIFSSSESEFGLLEFAMLDLSTRLQNSISDALFISSSMLSSKTCDENSLLGINSLLLDINSIINSNEEYYSNIYAYDKLDFVKTLKKAKELYSYSFEQRDFNLKIDIEDDQTLYSSPKEVMMFVSKLIEFLLSLRLKECTIAIKEDALYIISRDPLYSDHASNFLEIYNKDKISDLFGQKIKSIKIRDRS